MGVGSLGNDGLVPALQRPRLKAGVLHSNDLACSHPLFARLAALSPSFLHLILLAPCQTDSWAATVRTDAFFILQYCEYKRSRIADGTWGPKGPNHATQYFDVIIYHAGPYVG